MFVRIARFEGVENPDERIAMVRKNIEDGRRRVEDAITRGEGEGDLAVEGMRSISRALVGVDRAGGELVNLIFCETEDDLQRADAFLSSASPEPGGGHRTGVKMYEIVIDR